MSVAEQLQPGEEVLYQALPSRISLIPWLVLLVLLLAGSFLVWQQAGDPVLAALPAVPALVVALLVAGKWVVLQSQEYFLTNRRIIQQTGVLNKRSVDSYLDKVNNVEHVQTLWGRILGYGDVLVDTASETGTTVFRKISDPLDFKRAIVSASETYRMAARGGGMAMAPPPRTPTGADRLRELRALLDEGLISPEEYEAKRRQLVSEL
jgi:hypothetical protein